MSKPSFLTKLGDRLSRIRVGSVRYNSPWTQVVMVGIICFCSLGMSSAIGGLGAGGTQNLRLTDISQGVLYGFFAITGFLAGSIHNTLGPRITISLGTMGYALYVGSLWSYQVHGTDWFVILAGALLGISAALLWCVQGAVMLSYPEEKDKGRAFSVFWTIYSMGAIIGGVIALSIEAHSTLPTVSTGVYLAIMCIMIFGVFTSFLLLPPNYVVRGDGTLVKMDASIGVKEEFQGFIALFKDWRMLALFPMFFTSNYFYAYQGAIVPVLFNGRTRALNALVTMAGAVIGANVIGLVLDKAPFKRRGRAITGFVVVVFLEIAVWLGGVIFQRTFTRQTTAYHWDWTNKKTAGPLVLLASYYIGDAAYQGLAYYIMSAMTNDTFRLARMTGYYKGVQSAGAAISFAMDSVATPYMTELGVTWGLLIFSLPLAFLVIWKLPDSNIDIEVTIHAEDLPQVHAALPAGHEPKDDVETVCFPDKEEAKVSTEEVNSLKG